MPDMTLRISGRCGEGVILAGEILTLSAARSGLEVFAIKDYPAEMKGGLCTFQLRLGDQPILSQGDRLDLLMAFNEQAFLEHFGDLREDGLLVHDRDTFHPPGEDGRRSFGLGLTTIAQKELSFLPGRNILAVGILGGLLSLELEKMESVLRQALRHKAPEVVNKNLQALSIGYPKGQELRAEARLPVFQRRPHLDRLVLNGNQAIALGAMAAGCRFYSGYPITPATEIMERLAEDLPKVGGDMVQTEDEIAALAMALGASFAGKKAMTATSGPGLSLMTELLGLASMAEIPVVIVDVQRAGPSTGLPTKTEQSDLNHLLYGGHGEAPRIVIAPTTVDEAFYQTVRAFNLAEKYQMPVYLVSDQHLSQRIQTITQPDLSLLSVVDRQRASEAEGKYQRYELTSSGISAMSIPGSSQHGIYVATGLEHDLSGHPNYEPEMHRAMTAKRFRKLDQASRDLAETRNYGPQRAEVGVIGWGSTEGAVREAADRAGREGIPVAVLYPTGLNPLPEQAIEEFVLHVKKILVPEINYSGQFAGFLRARMGIDAHRLNKAGGAPFTPMEIYQKIKEVASDEQPQHRRKEPTGLPKRA
ncbi:MAG: 2-oxoacid:acceptor oxidoreductase subunit alpha [Dehalococcoidia bacterium]|nr:2-oxoacid:acceptor oxidoreductase subunit alpha [Dehalococcoidia bacterium]